MFSGSSGDSRGEFKKEHYILTLIKPSPLPSQQVNNISETKSLQADKDLEEDKRNRFVGQ